MCNRHRQVSGGLFQLQGAFDIDGSNWCHPHIEGTDQLIKVGPLLDLLPHHCFEERMDVLPGSLVFIGQPHASQKPLPFVETIGPVFGQPTTEDRRYRILRECNVDHVVDYHESGPLPHEILERVLLLRLQFLAFFFVRDDPSGPTPAVPVEILTG